MSLSLRELRVAWAVLVLVSLEAFLPDFPGRWLVGLWIGLLIVGAVTLAMPRPASRALSAVGAMLDSTRARIALVVLTGVLGLIALVFSPSAMVFAATVLSTLCLGLGQLGTTAPERFVAHAASLSGAIVVVLFPLELILRNPRVAREFGLPTEIARQAAAYDDLWKHNVFHFRSRHERVAPQPGRRRILALGDSFTWGLYIRDSDSTWPAMLERDLSGPGGHPVEVINAAQRGWTTANEAELLTRLGWQFDPDLVLVQYFVNDAYPSGPDFRFDEPARTYLVPEPFWKGYVRSSSVSALVSLGVNGVLYGLLNKSSETSTMYLPESAGYAQFRQALRQMGDQARARNTPLVFVLFPVLVPGDWSATSYPLQPLYERVAADARSAGLRVLDLTSAFAAQGGDWKRWWAVPYDSHPSSAAHAVAARAIREYLDHEGLLSTQD